MQRRQTVGIRLVIRLLVLFSVSAGAQSVPALNFRSVPTGLRPMGLGGFYRAGQPGGLTGVVVANSADNSVSVYGVGQTPILQQVLTGIPAPYGVSGCGTT